MLLPPIFAMHIPDGFLSIPVAALGWLLLIAMIALALRQTKRQLGERQIPLMGILAAFVFAAQMINFPVAGGTSGHLLGGTLVAILLGPWATILVMTCVLGVQALLFQDGGLLAIGFNSFNMGVIAAFVGYASYQLVPRLLGNSRSGQLAGAAVGAWISVEVAALATALELAISNTSPLSVALPAMAGVHALIGVGEALITVAALAFIQQTRPDLLSASAPVQAKGSVWIGVGLLIALAIAFASPLADPNPDGLERIAEDHGFLTAAQAAPYSLLPDYSVPFIEDQAISTIAAGIIGTLAVAGVGYGVARLVESRRLRDVSASKSI